MCSRGLSQGACGRSHYVVVVVAVAVGVAVVVAVAVAVAAPCVESVLDAMEEVVLIIVLTILNQ